MNTFKKKDSRRRRIYGGSTGKTAVVSYDCSASIFTAHHPKRLMDPLTLNTGSESFFEKLVTNYQSTRRNIPRLESSLIPLRQPPISTVKVVYKETSIGTNVACTCLCCGVNNHPTSATYKFFCRKFLECAVRDPW